MASEHDATTEKPATGTSPARTFSEGGNGGGETFLASARLRVLGVFVGLTVLLLLGLSMWQYQEARRTTTLLNDLTSENADAVTRVVELDGKTLQQFVLDYSPWDDMVTFVRT